MSETNEQRYLRLRWEHDPVFRRWLFTLAHNLAIAGGLCRSFVIGSEHIEVGEWQRVGERGWIPAPYWRPGCGHPAPMTQHVWRVG